MPFESSKTFPTDLQLELVVHLSRHGIRAPITLDPKYNITGVNWSPLAPAELTPHGARQLYHLGEKIRKRYIDELGFLPDEYDRRFFIARASPQMRNIASTAAFTLGLFPQGAPAPEKPRPHFASLEPEEFEKLTAALGKQYLASEDYNQIHMYVAQPDFMLDITTPDQCPGFAELVRRRLRKISREMEPDFRHRVAHSLETHYSLPERSLTFESASEYVDNYLCALGDGRSFHRLGERNEAHFKWYIGEFFNEGMFGDDTMLGVCI